MIRHAALIPAVNDGESTRTYWRVIYSNTEGTLSQQKVRSFTDRAEAVRFLEELPATYILYGTRQQMVAELQRVDLKIEHRVGVNKPAHARTYRKTR